MIRLLISLVTVGAVVGCSMEDAETSGSLSVDPNSASEIPDWLSIADVDHNRDGIVNIHDLVLVAHYFGQDVPADEIKSNTSERVSGPCGDIGTGLRYPKVEAVGNNENFKETFAAPDGNRYVYALVAATRDTSNNINIPKTFRLPACIAIRFLIDDKFSPKSITLVPVKGADHVFARAITSPALSSRGADNNNSDGYKTKYGAGNNKWPTWRILMASNFVVNPVREEETTEQRHTLRKEEAQRLSKLGIPIGGDAVIVDFGFPIKDEKTTLIINHNWKIGRRSNEPSYGGFEPSEVAEVTDRGAYIKMLPAEVQSRYFPEDIQ